MSTQSTRRTVLHIGMGCGIQIGLFIIMAIFTSTDDSGILSATLTYALAFILLSFLTRKLLLHFGFNRRATECFVGPCYFILAFVLALHFPIKTSDTTTESPAPESTVQTNAPPSTASRGLQEGEHATLNPLVPPPGVQFSPPNTNTIQTLDQALAQLDELVGLEPVKAEVRRFANFVQVNQKRKEQGLKTASITYHMVFSGNPGTGKTTVARIMADIYRTLGIVKNGHLVECDRGGLIAEYVGQTAIKTGNVIDFALDGVLFIDEAYAITDDGSRGYGPECIATLLKRMEDDRDRLVVIIAGYTDEMKAFIESNPGLKSRFNHYIDFPDYSPEELAQIFRNNATKNQYILSPEADARLLPYIRQATAHRDRLFGNARWVRNLLDAAMVRQADRLSSLENPTREQLMTLLPEDIGISSQLTPPSETNNK